MTQAPASQAIVRTSDGQRSPSSIVGASGSFYAQRRHLCRPFQPGLAPDFHSVLHTVEQGYRAISQPDAVGMMTALDNPKDEFTRKYELIG